jgi:hypothetical protein
MNGQLLVPARHPRVSGLVTDGGSVQTLPFPGMIDRVAAGDRVVVGDRVAGLFALTTPIHSRSQQRSNLAI